MLKTLSRRLLSGVNATKMVIIVRTDLKLGSGKIASQAAHAAVTLFNTSLAKSNPLLKSWLMSGQPKIILKIHSYDGLKKAYDEAVLNNLNACMIFDAGRTQIKSGTLTAIGIGPDKSEDIDKITHDFKLL